MKFHAFVRPVAAVLAAALAPTLALAQSGDKPENPAALSSSSVVTDVGPLPAEDRNSHGAIVLDRSLAPTNVMGAPPSPAADRKAARKAKVRADHDTSVLKRKGAGSLVEK